jgi:hypothetical protein
LKNVNPVPKVSRKYSIEKIATLYFIAQEVSDVEGGKKNQRARKVKEQRNRKCNSPSISCIIGQKVQRRKPIKTNFHYQETSEASEMICCERWENYAQTTNEDGEFECLSCRNWLRELLSIQRQMSRLR